MATAISAGATPRSSSIFNRFSSLKFRDKVRLCLPGITSSNTIEAIRYDEALKRIKDLKKKLTRKLNGLNQSERSSGIYFWLYLYILALSAQEVMISSMNDDLIASDVPWDENINIPSVSSTIGDAISYAERLKDPKDHFLKAFLLSFSGWTLLSTEKKECACSTGKLQETLVDVLVNTSLTKPTEKKDKFLYAAFFVGVQSDDQEHLERHYSFKEKSVRDEGLIIVHRSQARLNNEGSNSVYYCSIYNEFLHQAEQFRVNKMAKILDGLIDSFDKEA